VAASAVDEPRPGVALKLALLALPALWLTASVILARQAIRAWGAAATIDLADWVPTLIGLAFALAAFVGAVATLRIAWSATREPLRVSGPLLPLSFVIVVILALFDLGFAARIGAQDTYARWPRGDEAFSNAGAAGAGLAGAALYAAFVFFGATLFQASLQSEKGVRFAKRAGEVDSLGVLMARKGDERTRDRPV
jgi:hypothetical protein